MNRPSKVSSLLNELFRKWRTTPTHETETAFFSAVRNWALRRCRGDDDAAQNIVLAVLRGAADIHGNFIHWLGATARNLRVDEIRRQIAAKETPLDEDRHDSALSEVPSDVDWADLSAEEQAIAHSILEGYSLNEIAEAKGIEPEALRKRFQRLREQK